MWEQEYQDYPPDARLRKHRVETGRGIVGCEMNDIQGWGLTHPPPQRKKRGALSTLMRCFLGSTDERS